MNLVTIIGNKEMLKKIYLKKEPHWMNDELFRVNWKKKQNAKAQKPNLFILHSNRDLINWRVLS